MKMQGWHKLREDLLQSGNSSDESSNDSTLNSPNIVNHIHKLTSEQQTRLDQSVLTVTTNGHSRRSVELDQTQRVTDVSLDISHSPSTISLESSPGDPQGNFRVAETDSTPLTIASSPLSTSSKHGSTPAKKSPVRKSHRTPVNKTPNTPTTLLTEDISDDEILLIDIHKQRTKPIETLAFPSKYDPNIPLATDLQSLPGHCPDESRDLRFLVYNDVDTLSNHFETCLAVNREALLSSQSTRISSSRSHSNCLKKIFRFAYLKSLQMKKKSVSFLQQETKQLPLSATESSTATSFQTDWNVNRRHASSLHRHTPKNFFHVLQLNPRKRFASDETTLKSTTTIKKSVQQNFERVKDILARTYCPHMHTAIECGYQFGVKSKFPDTQPLVSTHQEKILVKEMPESPDNFEQSTTITLKSPTLSRHLSFSSSSPTIASRLSISNGIKLQTLHEPPEPPILQHRLSEEIDRSPPVIIKESFVRLSPPSFPLPSPPMIDADVHMKKKPLSTQIRKRKSPAKAVSPPKERKRKRLVSPAPSPPPPMPVNHYEDITDPSSEDDDQNDVLPPQLPKQTFIKNGLRSNYYKTSNGNKSTSQKRRRRQSSASLPPFYKGIFESDDEKSSYLDYRLPFDIYWFGQQHPKEESKKSTRTTTTTTSSPSSTVTTLHNKKKSNQPKQKQPIPYKKITSNVYTDQIRRNLLGSYHADKAPVCDCKLPTTCDEGVCLNRMMFTECAATCQCGTNCSNQQIRRNQWCKYLEVFNTTKYGQGLRATSPINKGLFICEYVGEIITEEKFVDRMSNLYSKDEHHYTMKLTQNLVIDAYRMGNIARFANHSCSPNCEFQKWTVDGLPRMCMFASRAIKPGEELTYDYNFQSFNLQAQQPCYCDSNRCRGVIGAKQQQHISSPSSSTTTNHQQSISILNQRLTQRERRSISQSSIFLLRNLRRIKDKVETKRKSQQQKQKQQSNINTIFTQNYHHFNRIHSKSTLNSLRKTPKLSHKDLFALFYNHIRRSHFAKTGRIHKELIDEHCYYAQLAQLTLIFNEIFDLLLNYKCSCDVTIPSSALRKCPSRRLFPAYYEIVSKPIDLTMMRNKLDQGEYSSSQLFEEDFLLLIQNAITYCGEDSDVAEAVSELKDYYLNTVKPDYQSSLNLFTTIEEEPATIDTLEEFVARFHEREVRDGQIRRILYDIIYQLDDEKRDRSPVVYRIVLANGPNSHRTSKSTAPANCIVHCRCGSVFDDISLVQCYACELWQHVACVSIADPTRPYYCFECQPACELDPSACLKTNVIIQATLSPLQPFDDHHQSYSTLTRADGLVIRINECYFVPKQQEKNIDPMLTSAEYDILCVERLWIDDVGVGQAAGFYFIRPNETFGEPTRKFFLNEVFRFPSSNDPLPISCFVRPCYVLDLMSYCRGKPISDNSSRVSSSDLFICEFRVDKTARTFFRLPKSRYLPINTKSYCFDSYPDKPKVKRDYQPHQKQTHDQQHSTDPLRCVPMHVSRMTIKNFEDKHIRLDGIIHKLYCLYHPSEMPTEMTSTMNHLLSRTTNSSLSPTAIDRFKSRAREIFQHTSNSTKKKSRMISLSSDDERVIDVTCDQRDSKKKSKQRPTNGKHLPVHRKRD